MLYIINFTRKEYLCVGKSKEQPVIAILQYLSKVKNWDINSDHVELISGETIRIKNIIKIFTDIGNELSWQERFILWRRKEIEELNDQLKSEVKLDDDSDYDDHQWTQRYHYTAKEIENIHASYFKNQDRLKNNMIKVEKEINDLRSETVNFKTNSIQSQRERLRVKELLKTQIIKELKEVEDQIKNIE
jgi:hypothetical protein